MAVFFDITRRILTASSTIFPISGKRPCSSMVESTRRCVSIVAGMDLWFPTGSVGQISQTVIQTWRNSVPLAVVLPILKDWKSVKRMISFYRLRKCVLHGIHQQRTWQPPLLKLSGTYRKRLSMPVLPSQESGLHWQNTLNIEMTTEDFNACNGSFSARTLTSLTQRRTSSPTTTWCINSSTNKPHQSPETQ